MSSCRSCSASVTLGDRRAAAWTSAPASGAGVASFTGLPPRYALRAISARERTIAFIYRQPGLLRRRHHEFGARANARRPALRHRFLPCIEADAFRSINMMVSEKRRLPAAEAVEGHRHRNGDVDADHSDLHALDEIARGVAVAGEDRRAVAELVLVDER